MLEKEMEDLIANYPDDFFPRKQFKLIGRQKTFPGVGRFDLMFKDEFDTTILMELKARPAKYKDADQLAKYWNALTQQGQKGVIMWLVAPAIPFSVRDFLDRIGIEYTEIHEAEFRRVAERHDYSFASEKVFSLSDPLDEAATTNMRNNARLEFNNNGKCRSKEEFEARLYLLKTTFPSAYKFLVDICDDPNFPEVYLGTVSNAHLYFRNCFLVYIQLNKVKTKPNFIRFSPKYHGSIDSGTIDRHEKLFSRLPSLIGKFDGFQRKWARREKSPRNYRHPVYRFTDDTPSEFFDELLMLINTLNC